MSQAAITQVKVLVPQDDRSMLTSVSPKNNDEMQIDWGHQTTSDVQISHRLQTLLLCCERFENKT